RPHVLGAGVQDDARQRVLIDAGRVHADEALALEAVRHAAGAAHLAAHALEDLADLAGGAVAVVGQHVHHDGHAVRPVALVGDLLDDVAGQLARAALDRPLDVVLRHADRPRLVDRVAQLQVHFGIAAAVARGDDDRPAELAEQLAPLGVDGPLLVL